MKSWNELSMAEKADVMKLAIEGGVYDLDAIRSGYNEYASGGKIHIKPSHRGRLTELKKRTGKSEAELYNDGNPAHKKMVVFARNARKWKHGLGGNLFDGTTQPSQQMQKVSDYRYVLDDNGEWNRIANDEMGRVFQGLTVTPRKTKQKFVPKRIDNSLEAAKAREKFFQYRDEEGHIKGEPGLEIVSPEFDLLSLGPIWNATGKQVVNSSKKAIDKAIANKGFAVSTPYLGDKLGRYTAWIPTNRSPLKGISWISTGKPVEEGLPLNYITSKASGEGRKLYDAGIDLAHKQGSKGLLVGDNLMSAPKSYSTYEHYYPNRVYVDDQGFWTNRNMLPDPNARGRSVYSLEDFLKETREHPDEKIIFGGAPRYRLETPSTQQPIQLPGNSIFSNEPETIGDVFARMRRDSNISKYANSKKNPVKQMEERMSDPEYRAMIKDNSSSMFTSKEDPIYIEGYDSANPNTYEGIVKQAEEWWNNHSTAFDNKDVVNNVVIPGLKSGQPFATGPAPYAYIPKKDLVFNIPIFKSTGKGEEAKELAYQIIKSHEGSHIYSSPRVESPLNSFLRTQERRSAKYLENKKGAELSARGSQLKSYFDKKSISEDELKYAANHYVDDTGVNNNMEDMFWHIKQAEKTDPNIWKKMAKWFTEVSPAVGTALYLNKD